MWLPSVPLSYENDNRKCSFCWSTQGQDGGCEHINSAVALSVQTAVTAKPKVKSSHAAQKHGVLL